MKEKSWKAVSVLCSGCLWCCIITSVLGFVFNSLELIVAAAVLMVMSGIFDTVQANMDPERYNRGDF